MYLLVYVVLKCIFYPKTLRNILKVTVDSHYKELFHISDVPYIDGYINRAGQNGEFKVVPFKHVPYIVSLYGDSPPYVSIDCY